MYTLPKPEDTNQQDYNNLGIDAFQGDTLQLHNSITFFSEVLVNSENKSLKIDGDKITHGFSFNQILASNPRYDIAVIGNHREVEQMHRTTKDRENKVVMNSNTYTIDNFMQDRADIFAARELSTLDNSYRVLKISSSDPRNIWRFDSNLKVREVLSPGQNRQGISVIIIPPANLKPKFR